MRLTELRQGEKAVVTRIADETVRAQAIRFGIAEGSEISCDEIIPHGPVIVSRGLMQYAIGRRLADQIAVDRSAARKQTAAGRQRGGK